MRSMKRIRNALTILMFILIAYTCAQTAGAYQLGEKEVQEDGHITGMSFEHGVTQADIMQIAELKNLKHLDLSFSDAVSENNIDLSPLGNLTDLQELSIYFYTDPDNEKPLNLCALGGLSKLKELYLIRIGVTDITPLSELENLSYLVLSETGVEDVKALRNLENLYNLEIFGNKSIKVKKQVETYMKHVETVTVTEEVPYGF